MANLGEIAQQHIGFATLRPLPVWRQGWLNSRDWSTVLMDADLSGVAAINGVPMAGIDVMLYYRPTGKLIKKIKTDAAGNFSFPWLDSTDLGNYFAVAMTDDVGNYNALIFDKLTAG